MPFVMQGSLLGDPPVVSGNVVERMKYILAEHADARDSYKAAMARYWLEFDGLEAALRQTLVNAGVEDHAGLAEDLADAFSHWFVQFATSPKTLQNRAMELQSAHEALDATPEVRAWRERQSRAGPVK